MTFQKPDEKTIARMTPQSIQALIEALVDKRDDLVAPYDEQIKYYKELLWTKKSEAKNAKTSR